MKLVVQFRKFHLPPDPLKPAGDYIYHLLSTSNTSVFFLHSVFTRFDNELLGLSPLREFKST